MTSRKKGISKRQGHGNAVIYPSGIQARWGISAPTRWRYEKNGRLPPRDFFIGGVAVGWRPETIAAAEAKSAA